MTAPVPMQGGSANAPLPTAAGWALEYAKRGWHVFPCRPDKKPYTEHGFLDATTNLGQIHEWWRRFPNAQVGVACGASGLLVVDLDRKPGKADGDAAFEALAGSEPHGAVLVASTPSGGRHLVYAAADGTFKTTTGTMAPGIDTRATGGYFIAPSGMPGREWIAGDPFEDRPTGPPEWLQVPRFDNAPVPAETPRSPLALALGGVPEGSRNAAAAQLAGKLLAHGLRDEAWPLLCAWNAQNSPPLDQAELRRVCDSVARGDVRRHPERYLSPEDATSNTFTPPSVTAATGPSKTPPWLRQSLDELLATPLHPWVIQRYFRLGQLGFVCAFPSVGKSTMVASWIMATLYGRSWGGRRVRGGSVVALVGEGRRGFANRLDAYRRHHSLGAPPDNRYIEVVDFRLPLSSPAGQAAVRQLIDTITSERGHAPTLVVIDTLSSHWAESEDSAEFGAPAMRALADLAHAHSCAVVVVHHVTKAKGKFVMPELADIRGSSSFAGNTDFVFAMCATQDDDGALLCGLKLKDDEQPPVIEMRRISVALGEDADGDQVTAALLEPGDGAAPAYDPAAAERIASNLVLNLDVNRIVEALRDLGSAPRKDAVVLAAHLKAQRGRACFDIALSKGLIRNDGTTKHPLYVVASREGGRRKEPKEGRDVEDVPVPVRDVPDVRDDTGRRDVTADEGPEPGDDPLFSPAGNRELRKAKAGQPVPPEDRPAEQPRSRRKRSGAGGK